jgi:serine protease
MRLVLTLLVLLAVSTPVQSATIHVPGDQPTIRAGIDVANVGDIVQVACNTYFEHDLLMKSGITLSSETGQPDCVTIDAQSQGRVLICEGIDPTTSIEGFTFTGGSVHGEGFAGCGGAVYCHEASPTFSNCVFATNDAEKGAAAACVFGAPSFESCMLLDNYACAGGGLYLNSSAAQFRDCIFENNEVYTDGAAAFISYGELLFDHCIMYDNLAGWWGGAIFTQGSGNLHLLHCTMVENQTVRSWGAAIFTCGESTPLIENCLIAFNQGDGAVNAYDSGSIPAVVCCDVYGNEGGNCGGVLVDQTGLDGNISAEPLFCDLPAGDLTVAAGSPCLPENNDCQVLMGALGQGCEGSAGVTAASEPGGLRWLTPTPAMSGGDIIFRLTEEAVVTLRLHDLQGRQVRELCNGQRMSAGLQRLVWDGYDDQGARVDPGVYFYMLDAGESRLVGKVILSR